MFEERDPPASWIPFANDIAKSLCAFPLQSSRPVLLFDVKSGSGMPCAAHRISAETWLPPHPPAVLSFLSAQNKELPVTWVLLCLKALVRTSRALWGGVRRGRNGHKFPCQVGMGGHNNTKINPVFRGMIWRRSGGPDF